MSHQDNLGHDSRSQESLNFLKTVVDQDSGQIKTGTDSDKENDNNSSINTMSNTKQFELSLSSLDVVKDKKMNNKEDTEMWDDFYSEEDFDKLVQKEEELSQNGQDSLRPNVLNSDRVLEKVEEEEEDGYVEDSNATDTMESHTTNTKENNTSDSKLNEDSAEGQSRRKRKKRLFKRVRQPLSPRSRTQAMGGSHPNLGGHARSRSNSSDQHSNQLETMSDTSGNERKLSLRKQVSRPRCAGPAPSQNRLEQKYQELEQLMLKPLANPAVYVKQTRQQMVRLQGLSTSCHPASHDPASLPPKPTQPVIQIIEYDTNQAYSTMRTVQAVNGRVSENTRPNSAHPRPRPMSGQRARRPMSAGQIKPTAKNLETNSVHSNMNSNDNRIRGRKRNDRSDSSVGSHRRSDRSESGSQERDYASSFEGDARSRSSSCSPSRNTQNIETHLKNSSNPALRQWLKKKDKEYRKQKLEERNKKRKERAEKQEEELKKQEFLKNAEEKVKEWMAQKRKQAWKQAKEERSRKKEEEFEISEQQQKYTESLRGKMFIPIKRPEGNNEKENKKSDQQSDNAPTTPQPPTSKFVYKRPVSGRVRLMKLQQERKEDAKKLDAKKKEMEKLLSEEKDRKMRISYDQWLLKKREEDYTKRQVAAKQRELAKSDPELDRIVPEMARRRIEKIKRGKKRLEIGDSSLDRSVNRSFGGGDFGEAAEKEGQSYRLEITGDKKSLKQRPSSANPSEHLMNPKQSKSPRRPQSANPRVHALMDETESQDLKADLSFKLPFPPDLGVPKYVAAKQEKLFSESVMSNGSLEASSSMTGNVETNDTQFVADGVGDQGSQGVNVDDDLKSRIEDDNEMDDGSNFGTRMEGTGSTEDNSFFVTDGNVPSQSDLLQSNERMDNNPGIEKDMQEEYFSEKTDDFFNDSLQSQKSEDEVEDDDIVQNNENEGQENNEFVGKDEMNIVPPLDIGTNDADLDYEEENKDDGQEEMDLTDYATEPGEHSEDNTKDTLKSPEAKSSMKHVSFSKDPIVFEDLLAGISHDFEYYDDVKDDKDKKNVNNQTAKHLPPGESMSEFFKDEDDDLDEIEGYEDEYDEAEHERGDDF